MSTTEAKQVFIPSAYQKAIFEAGAKGNQNIVVNATAGSGKTKTIQEFIMNHMPKNKSWIYLVFNKKNQLEAEQKLAKATNGRALTFHALGFGAIRRSLGSVQVENNKVIQIIRTVSDVSEKSIWGTVAKVVGITKNTLTNADDFEAMEAMCERYNIDLNGSQTRIFQIVREVINECRTNTFSIDFDDMIWLPIVLNLPMAKYDYVLVDEGQDLNAAQVEMVLRIRKSTGCTIVIGDRNQAIYGFRGAGINAMDVLSETLEAKNLPLAISYRNPRAIVKLVNDTFPNIKHECSLTAPEGKFAYITQSEFRQTVKPKDMVLCRTNAPLVAPAFDLIRNGVKAIIMGKSIGEELENLINKVMKTAHNTDVQVMLERLGDYHMKQTAILMSKNKEASAQALDDKVETINVLAEDCEEVSEVVEKIRTVFSDEVDGVVFSSTHRAKGLESRNVFILRFDLMPHPRAIWSGNAWAIKEEENCKFVALTRTLNNLYIVEK